MAAIEHIESGHYRIPLDQVLTDSTHGAMEAFELVTVRITDADGAVGLGYTYTPGHNGAAIHATIRHDLAPILQGADADLIEKRFETMWWTTHYGGRGGAAVFAISAIDIALWDLKAKRTQSSLWRLLGGYDEQVPVYAGGIDLLLPLDALLEQTDRNLERGFRAIKMKVGRDILSEDVARVEAMRAHLGHGFALMVDANMRWSVDQAIRAIRALEACALVWIEEPTIPEDIAGHARIVQTTGAPIATGENFRSVWEFKNMIAAGGVSFPEPDVTNCGGVTHFMKIARLAEAYNLPVTSHGAHDITVQLLAACPNRSYLEAHGFGLEQYITEPLVIKEGNAIAPERPGHGIDFDWAGLARLQA